MNLELTSDCTDVNRCTRAWLLGLLLAAFVIRAGVLWVWFGNLTQDRDVYLAIAKGVAEGRGFSVQGSDVPTAFRPPLYPLLLVVTGTNDTASGRALLHLILGLGTVWLTFLLGKRLGLSHNLGLFAGALVAIDPLLLRYSSFPMTETLATFLATALLLCLASPQTGAQQFVTGVVYGLNVLCRPTMWSFAGLMALWLLLSTWRSRSGRLAEGVGVPERFPWIAIATALITVLPWVIRNALVMGHPIVMTTHGGYTLLLGNNPSFYREVVDQPWGTVWDGSHGEGQAVWVETVNRRLDEAGVTGEVARDRRMKALAQEHIREQPVIFLRACWLRFLRFWSISPHGEAGSTIPSAGRLLIGLFYLGIFLLALIGMMRVACCDLIRWCPVMLMIAAFTTVHLVYWSNARMRSPVVPAVALLASRSLSSRRPSVSEAGVCR